VRYRRVISKSSITGIGQQLRTHLFELALQTGANLGFIDFNSDELADAHIAHASVTELVSALATVRPCASSSVGLRVNVNFGNSPKISKY
jgi:hypothetical protein